MSIWERLAATCNLQAFLAGVAEDLAPLVGFEGLGAVAFAPDAGFRLLTAWNASVPAQPGETGDDLHRRTLEVIGAPLRAPHLSDLGYALVGGRLLSAPEGPAAQFMYEDAKSRRITLYVVRNPRWHGKAEFRFAERDGVSVFYWIEGTLGYALTAEMARPELFDVAQAVHRQLGP